MTVDALLILKFKGIYSTIALKLALLENSSRPFFRFLFIISAWVPERKSRRQNGQRNGGPAFNGAGIVHDNAVHLVFNVVDPPILANPQVKISGNDKFEAILDDVLSRKAVCRSVRRMQMGQRMKRVHPTKAYFV